MPKNLTSKALKSLPKKTTPAHKTLLKALGDHISDKDIEHFNSELLVNASDSHWNLALKRKENDPKIRIYCPHMQKQKLKKTVIDIVANDMVFLVDSVVAEINKHNLLIDFLIHQTLYAKYDDKNNLQDLSLKAKKGYIAQSHIHIHIKETVSDKGLTNLEKGLYTSIEDVSFANRDWVAMLAKLKETRLELAKSKIKRPKKEIEQYCAFLDYLHDNNFTLLGYREYEFVEGKDGLKSKTVRGENLGLLHKDIAPAYISERAEGLPRNLQELRRSLPPVSISKTNRLATVHRRVPMDAIAIKTYDENGKVKGEKLFLGLFTSVTYSRSVSDVPFLREKVDAVVDMSDFMPQSHDRKALRHILEKYPRDELFQISEPELLDICLNILRLQERQRIAAFIRRDPFGRYISCLVYIPRDRFGSTLRKQIGEILEQELSGKLSNFYTSLDDSLFARVMFVINIDQKTTPKYNPAKIEALLQDAGQTWQERLGASLSTSFKNEGDITSLTLKYGEAFPVEYTTRYKAIQSVFDIKKIEEALNCQKLKLDLYKPDEVGKHQLRLKVYNPGSPLNLSDVMPILDNMGLRAISELPFKIQPRDTETPIWIHDFLLETCETDAPIVIKDIKSKFEMAFTKIWYGDMDSDALNKLVLSAALDWDETIIIRAYVRYLKQIGYSFGRLFVERTLTEHPKITRMIIDLFKALHDPKNTDSAEDSATAYLAGIETALENVPSLDQDRILRSILNLVHSTLRTNYYQREPDGQRKPSFAIKLDSTNINDLPAPKPYRETFVYSRRVEAIHLRGDKIARGGLRWSDRHEDYRTEVLGLMKAQMVKNAVIVPNGSKGGFIVKTPTKTRDEFMAEGIECYKIFIRGLLDICDNRKGKSIIPPKNVVRRDGDDPYLVVAADKGTATFSDIANGISQDYGFWLDDAFASGGSAGYDHKKMGITARGAWESVKLLFRQLNHDTQTKDFDVLGIGDMGGDVFGNGMLLSRHIRLVGAFNHLHIFCDPSPDAETSFKERQKLFDNVQGWDHYDTSKLSKGGKIYSRSDKSLTLTPEIRKRFDIDKPKVSPIELMNAMLKARTDLLWFGGIGTYIKASSETHADASDKANDALRVDGNEVRAKVIGEGANLGVTQLGRIELSKKGGNINTDFLDNSGGVDSSDHEVNIKILLTDVMSQTAHKMDLKSRNKLLESMTEEVAQHVLRNNYQQAQAIGLAEMQARENLKIQAELIQDLERNNGLDRAVEFLPDQEQIDRRLRANKGLTRPELCVILSYAKLAFTKDLMNSDIPENPDMQDWLTNYFPTPLQKKYGKEIKRHRLAREIIATTMTNSLINRMGPTFIKSVTNKTGANCADIARAYIIVRESFNMRELWDAIEALDNKVPAEVQLKAMRDIAALAEHAVTWFLNRSKGKLDIGDNIQNYGNSIKLLRKNIKTLLTSTLKSDISQRAASGERDGLPKSLAHQLSILPILSSACDIISISLKQKTDIQDTAEIYFQLGEQFHFDWLRQQARFLTSEDYWQREALDGLMDQLYSCQAHLTARIFKDMRASHKNNKDILDKWLSKHAQKTQTLEDFFKDVKLRGSIEFSVLVIAEQRLRNLYED